MFRLKVLAFSLLLLFSELSKAQLNNFASKAQKLIGVFNAYHYNPIAIDGITGSQTVDIFINEIDKEGQILTSSDVNRLKIDSENFFNQIYANNNEFAVKSHAIYLSALKSVDSILATISAKKINFTENDTLYAMPFSSPVYYSPNKKMLSKRLEKIIKYNCMERVMNTDGYEKLTEAEFIKKAQDISSIIILNYQKRIKELIQGSSARIESDLLNAIALRHDPHSNYFTQEQNKEFTKQLSKQVETFGFYLGEDENANIVIAAIEPGSSAWMSNNVNEGDLFISLTLDNITINNSDKSADEIQEFIEKSTSNKLSITLKKPNGQQNTVKLIKQKATSEENTVKGYVLKNESSSIGYISLPTFYTDMFNHTSPGCANDVAKEILKLESDNIKGLIIDLRNNGGGSMLEAMNLAGIFVDEGPLFIYKERAQKPHLQKDLNRGSIFKKPIIVLINETSASASELFCNIVKDYNLGVVVGQMSYGKGTAQSIIPLDTNALKSEQKMKTATDFLKITHAKFYRLNGTTHQGEGVLPDVYLPSVPGYSNYRENKELYFLSSEKIVKNVIYTPKPKVDIVSLQERSKKRIDTSSDYKQYKRSSDSLLSYFNEVQKIILKHKEVIKYNTRTDKLYQSYMSACKIKESQIKCEDNTFDQKITNVNDQKKEFNLKIRESIREDIFINESFNIINDLISLAEKNQN